MRCSNGALIAHVAVLLTSFVGVLWFLRSCYLLGFAAFHHVPNAYRNLILILCRCAFFVCTSMFLGLAVALAIQVTARIRRNIEAG